MDRPPQQAITADTLARYEEALAAPGDDERELVHLRLNSDFAYDEIARA